MANNKRKILPVIMSGGIGSRLWPISRKTHPKPFIKLQDNQSLIQKTFLRLSALANMEEIITVTNRDLFFYSKDEYKEVANPSVHQSFILEPVGKNSAAAIALASFYAASKYSEEVVLLIVPADHIIKNQQAFEEAVKEACNLAEQDKIVTFGIHAESPNTGYGYIEASGNDVKRFIEKPPLEKAKEYVKLGNYYWNAGMFCVKPEVIVQEMQVHCVDVLVSAKQSFENSQILKGEVTQVEVPLSYFEKSPEISIDFALIEKSKNIAVVPCDIGWSDIGSWDELGKFYPLDANNNNVLGETIFENVENCIAYSENKLIAGIGLKNLVIADTEDALLISDRDRLQDVKKIVKVLEKKKHATFDSFKTVYRPWGKYTVLQEGERFKVKRIEVSPKCSLSLQSHKHRSEHWVVVSGVANIINGDDSLELSKNQSTYIPVGAKHRLENLGEELLVLIEVQCGDYLGEDDIIRYEDVYGR